MDDQEWWVNAVKGAKTLSDIEFVFRSLWPGLFPKPFRKPLFSGIIQTNTVGHTGMEKNLKIGGRKGSFTPSTALLNLRLDTFSKPRMLTEYEIKLLRQSKKEIGEAVRKRFKEKSI